MWDASWPADFVVVGAYSAFETLNTGQGPPMDAMITGQLQVQGEQSEVTSCMAVLTAMQDVLLSMRRDGTTEWPA